MSGLFTRRRNRTDILSGPAERRPALRTQRIYQPTTMYGAPGKATRRQPLYLKTLNQLEVGRSYSEIQDANVGTFRTVWKKKAWPRGVYKGKRLMSLPSETPTRYQFMFEKKNIDVTQDDIDKGEKRFILNCKKGGYGTRRATLKVRRHTRRRVPE